jgi:hypothetical protein
MAVTETRTLPAQFVEDIGTDLAKQLVAQTGIPVVSTGVAGISQQSGETPEQFAARQKAAQQFQIRQQSLSGLAPQIAGQDPLQQQAQHFSNTRYWIVSTISTTSTNTITISFRSRSHVSWTIRNSYINFWWSWNRSTSISTRCISIYVTISTTGY